MGRQRLEGCVQQPGEPGAPRSWGSREGPPLEPLGAWGPAPSLISGAELQNWEGGDSYLEAPSPWSYVRAAAGLTQIIVPNMPNCLLSGCGGGHGRDTTPACPAYLEAVSHDDHAGVRQGTEQLPCGSLLLLPVVLLLGLDPGHPAGGSRDKALAGPRLSSSHPPAPPWSGPGGGRGQGQGEERRGEELGGAGRWPGRGLPPPFGRRGHGDLTGPFPQHMTNLCPLFGPVPTLRASFLVTLAVGDTHSLSDPLYSLYSACGGGVQNRHQHAVWGCRGLGGGQVGLRSEKGAPVPHGATPSVRLTSKAGSWGYRDGGLGVAKDSMWAGAQRCPEASTQPSPCAQPLGGGPHVRCGLPSPVPWELLSVGPGTLRSLPTAAGRQVHRGGGLAPQARWTRSMGREQQSGVWG